MHELHMSHFEEKMLNLKAVTALTTTCASILASCASIVNGSNQVISVDARHKDQPLAGASCQLNIDKGIFYVTTRGTVTVHRPYDDMHIKCDKEGMSSGITTVKSSTKPIAFGNILFSGPIDVAVNAGTGAVYDYPPLIIVLMDDMKMPAMPSVVAAPKTEFIRQTPSAP